MCARCILFFSFILIWWSYDNWAFKISTINLHEIRDISNHHRHLLPLPLYLCFFWLLCAQYQSISTDEKTSLDLNGFVYSISAFSAIIIISTLDILLWVDLTWPLELMNIAVRSESSNNQFEFEFTRLISFQTEKNDGEWCQSFSSSVKSYLILGQLSFVW